MTSQLKRWQGEFGEAYTDRNQVDPETRVDAFRWLVPAGTKSVFEVGTNAGHNLRALRAALPVDADLHGCEPAAYARKQAAGAGHVCSCSVYDLEKWHHTRWDLVFTSGVLIHVPPARLDLALRNIYALANRHILAIEYPGQDEAISYRGHSDMLWKRDYGRHYQQQFPNLHLIDSGVLTEQDGFKDSWFWLLEKR